MAQQYKFYKTKKAFTLIECLVSLCIIGVTAFAFMSILLALENKSQDIEIDTIAQNLAVETIGNIRANKNEIVQLADVLPIITEEQCFTYEGGANLANPSDSPNPWSGMPRVNCSSFWDEISNWEDMTNSEVCGNSSIQSIYCNYGDPREFRPGITYDSLFYRIVTLRRLEVAGSDSDSVLVTVYVATMDTTRNQTFVRLSTVISQYD